MTLSLDSWPPGDGEMFGLDWGVIEKEQSEE